MFARSFFRGILTALACLGALLGVQMIVVPSAIAGVCECPCAGPGGITAPGMSQSCNASGECSMVTCQISCGNYGPGYTPVPPEGGRRTYTCIGGIEESFGIAPQGAQQGGQQRSLVPGQTDQPQGGTAPTGGTTGGAETASPTGGTTGGTTTPPPIANTQAAPPAGTLRFILPDCTTDGNCSLTDIMNTGIRVANLLLAFAGVAFLVTVLWAGAQLLIFAYEAKSVVRAQKLLTSAVTGLIIIMVAGVIVRLVSDTLGVDPALLRAPGGTSTNAPGAQPFRNLGPGSGNGSLPSSNSAFPTGGN